MPASWASFQGQDISSWPLILLLAALLGSLLSPVFFVPSLLTEHYAGTTFLFSLWCAGLFFLLSFFSRPACPSTMASQPPSSSPAGASSSSFQRRYEALPALDLESPQLFNSFPLTSNNSVPPQKMPSLQLRRRGAAGTQRLQLQPFLIPLDDAQAPHASMQTPAPQTPSPSLVRRGGAVAGAALMATMMATSPTRVVAYSKVMSPTGVPVADYFEPEHEGSLRLWLKPSGTMVRNSGRVSRVFSSSNFALAKNASPQPNAYAGLTIVVGGQTRLISGYTGDINGDGDVLDAGEAHVFLDEPLHQYSPLVAGRTSYTVFEGFSVAAPPEAVRVTKETGQGNDVLQWSSAAKTVILVGEVWSTADQADRVLLGPSAIDVDGSYEGLTMAIGSESRTITHYNGHSRAATVSPAFSQELRRGATFRVFRVHSARVRTVPQLQGPVLAVSPISPTMRFQIHPPVSEPAVLSIDYTGHEMTLTTGLSFETCVILAHTADGFVSVTQMENPASNNSKFVVHGARPTLTAGGRAGLQGYGVVALDGKSSFLTFDSAVAPVNTKRQPAFADTNFTSFAPRNCSAGSQVCAMSEQLFRSNSDATAAGSRTAMGDKWSMTFLSVVRPSEDKEQAGVVGPVYISSGTLAPPDQAAMYHSGSKWVRLGTPAGAVQNLYTGTRIRLMLLDGTKVDRVIVSYSLDRRAVLDQPVPLEMVPSKTRFFITNIEPTESSMALGAQVPSSAGALVGMQMAVAGEWRTITHHGAAAYSSDSNGRVVTLNSPLSAVPVAGSTRYQLVGAHRLLSLDSAKAHIDVGVGRVRGEEAGEPPLVYQSTVQDGQLHAVSVLSGGSGYVLGGSFDLEIGGSSWHLGSFSCGQTGSVSNVTLFPKAPTVYPGDSALEGAIKYPARCNGKTKDTSHCASKSQHSSVSSLELLSTGANYLPGQLRAKSCASGTGFSSTVSVDDTGAIVDYQIPNAEAHGTGYGAETEVDIFYLGTSTKMTGSITSVDVLEGGSGHKAGPLVVSCEGHCVGTGLVGGCEVDAIGAVTKVVIISHGKGYKREEPPFLSCGYAGSVPLLIANVASGAKIQAVVASGVVLAAEQTRQESSSSVSARVSRVVAGKGNTIGCSVGDELLGVGGGGRGLVVQVAEVSSTGEILKMHMHNSGTGYSTAPRLVAKNKACRCSRDGSVWLDGTIPGNMDACWTPEISRVVPVSDGWQIQAIVVDGERGDMHHYVGGLQARHRMSTVDIGQAARSPLDFATLGARRATKAAGEYVSQLWKGELAEVLVYQCAAASGAGGFFLGCTTPADLDRLGQYMANKFQLSWEASAGLTEGISGATAGEDHALSVVQGKAGAGSVPLLRSVHPRVAMGTLAQTITISGRYFGAPGDEDAVQVRVGNLVCTQLKLMQVAASAATSNSSLSSATDESVAVCVVPGSLTAIADVTVTAWGVPGVLSSAFRHGAPKIQTLLPAKVHSSAGTVLTIIGANLDSSLSFSVKLQSHTTTTCTRVEVVSGRELRCHLPQLLRTDTSVILALDNQGEDPVVSIAQLEVSNVPTFYTECPQSEGRTCMTCCMRSCQRWELSPEGNNRALGGAYYDHCTDECTQRVCPSSSTQQRG